MARKYNTRGRLYRGYSAALVEAAKQLRVFESTWQDLDYPEGDPRRAIPDSEQPQEVITERDHLRRQVTRYAALVGGETHAAADMLADTPLAESNPYNLDRVRLALAIVGEKGF